MRLCLVLSFLAVAACGPDPDLVLERDQLQQQVDGLDRDNTRLEREADRLHAQVRKLTEQVAHLQYRETLTQLGMTEGQRIEARIDTRMGTITCELWPDKAPVTVLNFVQLAEGHKEWTDPRTHRVTHARLYDGTLFHRVVPEFMIQGGDPLGTGAGGPGFEFADETSANVGFTEPGLLAMANHGPDTNGSQFFITDRATPTHLNGKHTIFGKCGDLDVVQAIATVQTEARNKPARDVVIRKLTILRE